MCAITNRIYTEVTSQITSRITSQLLGINMATSFRKQISPVDIASGRYRLIASLSCPFANRVLIARKVRKLEQCIQVTFVYPKYTENGWRFAVNDSELEHCMPDITGKQLIKEYYLETDPMYKGIYSVPILVNENNKIVNNESMDIMRMFTLSGNGLDVLNVHTSMASQIENRNLWISEKINNGVYKVGNATTQDEYESRCKIVFEGLDQVEEILSRHFFLNGYTITESDILLFPSIMRFDPVYAILFKCNIKSILEYPNIMKWSRYLYSQWSDLVNMEHIKMQFYSSPKWNPNQIVALGNGPQW